MDVHNLWLLSGAKEVEKVLAMHLYSRQWLAVDGLGTCKRESNFGSASNNVCSAQGAHHLQSGRLEMWL